MNRANETKRDMVYARVDRETYEKIQRLSKDDDRSLSYTVRKLLSNALTEDVVHPLYERSPRVER